MKISVKVPATTANLGPGFDCMGMALPIYNTVTIEETVLPGTGVEINIISENESVNDLSIEHLELNENSLILLRANNIRDGEINHDEIQFVSKEKD